MLSMIVSGPLIFTCELQILTTSYSRLCIQLHHFRPWQLRIHCCQPLPLRRPSKRCSRRALRRTPRSPYRCCRGHTCGRSPEHREARNIHRLLLLATKQPRLRCVCRSVIRRQRVQLHLESHLLDNSLHHLVRHILERAPQHHPQSLLELERQHLFELSLRLHVH